MSYVTELMDKVKATHDIPSDYALAQKLGVTRASISRWRLEKTIPEWDALFKMADLLQLDDQDVVHNIIAEKQNNPRVIKVLETSFSV
ncbi:helix-turn-helix domain-containing protein [Enterovibrio norvegicus]|uniref:helix-turn-helix domain-containing protein n=1 Tax=Enterovibrio norvegicus TaxID=188144 RepID=UPI00354D71E2